LIFEFKMKNVLLEDDSLVSVELGEVTEEKESNLDSHSEGYRVNVHRFLEFLFEQNARITSVPRVVGSALYLVSGVQNATWLRSIGSSITLVSSILGVIINQKKDVPYEASGRDYFLEMFKRSFQPIDHIRQFTGPLLFLSSTCIGIGGVMSGRYTELIFMASGWFLGALAMFTPTDVDANIYAGRFRAWIMPFIFLVNGVEAFVDGDSIAISSMVLNQISTYFSLSINAWGKMSQLPDEDEKTCLKFTKLCCFAGRTDVKPTDEDAISVSR
jgi:hypothetical protein